MKKVIFLDRDGVVNRERGDYTWRVEDFEFNSDFFAFCKTIKEKGYSFVIITNQSGIAKGLYTLKDVETINNIISQAFTDAGLHLLEIYLCPHHPEAGSCICRKPGSQLMEKAIARFNIDPKQSYMIGDRDRDCEAAARVGVTSFLVESNAPLMPLLDMIH